MVKCLSMSKNIFFFHSEQDFVEKMCFTHSIIYSNLHANCVNLQPLKKV